MLFEVEYQLTHITLRGLSNQDPTQHPSKPLMLALHGWLDNANSFQPLMPLLQNYHVVAIDWVGHGYSSHRPEGADYHQLDYIDDLYQLIESQDWQDVILLGHSMGGILASLYAAAFPERVRCLISIDAYGPLEGLIEETTSTLRSGIISRQRSRQSTSSNQGLVLEDMVKKRQAHSELSAELLTLLLSRSLEPVDTNNLATGFRWLTDKRLRNQSLIRLTRSQAQQLLTSIACPMLIVVAEQGFVKQRGFQLSRNGWVPHAVIVELPGGHHLHMGNPDSVATQIERFVGEVEQ